MHTLLSSAVYAPGGALRVRATGGLGTLRPGRALALLSRVTAEHWLLAGVVGIALIAHAINMFDFLPPTAKDDEGIYTAQAWAVLREFRLTPYTYWYDHAPGGWLLLAAWMALTGGPRAFGLALDSGRVLMLVLHLGSVVLLYRVARKLGSGACLAALACLLFSVSPLVVFYARLVLLDNIMVFWTLLSLDLLLDSNGRLSRLVLSGACFGWACISKETALVLTPAFLMLLYQRRHVCDQRFGPASWIAPMLVVVSWYPLYAALKNELLPAGESILFLLRGSTSSTSVSLTDALKWQATRGGGGALNLDNQFWQLVRGDWLARDRALMLGGVLAIAVNLIGGVLPRRFRSPNALAVGLLGLLPLAYLGRGGVVFDFYILAALPFLCLNFAYALEWLGARLHVGHGGPISLVLASALLSGYWYAQTLQPLYTQQPGVIARQAIPWIKSHLPADSKIITPDDLWTDLHEPGAGGPAFPNAHSHWKVAADPEIRDGVFNNDWHTVDYLIMAPGLEDSFAASGDQIAIDALHNAHVVQEWQADGASLSLWKVDHAGSTEDHLLAASRASMLDHFEHSGYGAYVSADGSVLSESQAYALLRDVWSDDRTDFNRTWAWTSDHLLRDDGLPVWLWRYGSVVDAHTATDADTDMALALLMASKRWQDPALLEAGRTMVAAIWQHEVVSVAGKPLISTGDWVNSGASGAVPFNPSYFAPYAYRVFAEVDGAHDWRGVIDAGYTTLFAASRADLGASRSAGLPPDWVGVDAHTGDVTALPLAGKADTTAYAYDAPRTYWRVAVDLQWSGDGRADAYLRQAGFLRDEVARKGLPSAAYEHDGSLRDESVSAVGVAGALAALSTLEPASAHAVFAAGVLGRAQAEPDGGMTWDDPDDIYAQAWGWFATALYDGRMTDLWHGS